MKKRINVVFFLALVLSFLVFLVKGQKLEEISLSEEVTKYTTEVEVSDLSKEIIYEHQLVLKKELYEAQPLTTTNYFEYLYENSYIGNGMCYLKYKGYVFEDGYYLIEVDLKNKKYVEEICFTPYFDYDSVESGILCASFSKGTKKTEEKEYSFSNAKEVRISNLTGDTLVVLYKSENSLGPVLFHIVEKRNYSTINTQIGFNTFNTYKEYDMYSSVGLISLED